MIQDIASFPLGPLWPRPSWDPGQATLAMVAPVSWDARRPLLACIPLESLDARLL